MIKKAYLLIVFSFVFFFSFSGEQSINDFESVSPEGEIHDSVVSVYDSSVTVLPVDTFDTSDKFTKIVLYSNKTWAYFDMGKPVINDSCFDEYWNTNKINSYKELSLKELPNDVDICLVDSLHPYHCPYMTKRINSRYRYRYTRPHWGIDLSLKVGDPICAVFDGKVRVVKHSRSTGGYGNLIVIRHPNGLETYYAHLSRQIVKPGEIVKAGEVIGYGGSTGRSTGPHLHFEVRYKGHPFDPERIIDFKTGVLRDTIYSIKKHYFSIYSHYGQTDTESKLAAGRIFYKIRPGDTLSEIAHKYHTSVSKICRLNNMSGKTILRIGRRLIVR